MKAYQKYATLSKKVNKTLCYHPMNHENANTTFNYRESVMKQSEHILVKKNNNSRLRKMLYLTKNCCNVHFMHCPKLIEISQLELMILA